MITIKVTGFNRELNLEPRQLVPRMFILRSVEKMLLTARLPTAMRTIAIIYNVAVKLISVSPYENLTLLYNNSEQNPIDLCLYMKIHYVTLFHLSTNKRQY